MKLSKARMTLAFLAIAAMGVSAACAPNKDDENQKRKLTSLCVVKDKEKETDAVPAAFVDMIVQWKLGLCVKLGSVKDKGGYSADELATHFPEISREELRSFDQFTALLCPSNKATAAKFPDWPSTGRPDVVSFKSGLEEACEKHPSKPFSNRSSWGMLSGPPGLAGLSLSAPSSSNIRCSSGVPDPYAQSSGTGVYDNYNQPANKAKEELVKEISMYFGVPTAAGLLITGGKPTRGTWAVGMLGAVGKAVELAVNPEAAAAKVGRYMWDQAIFVADQAVGAAIANADAADVAAKAARGLAASNPNDPALKRLADEATAAANASREHAQKAKDLAEQTKATATNSVVNAQAAERESAEAKKQRDEAEKKRKEAEDLAKEGGTATPAPQQGGPTQRPAPGSSGDVRGCDDLRAFVWEFEQRAWQSGPCQEFLWKIHNCPGDIDVIYPTDDGFQCAGKNADVNPATAINVVRVMCERLIHPAPGEDPCDPASLGITGGIKQAKPGACDPEIAFTEPDGCPVEPQVVIEMKQFCLPSPPYLPPLPCVATGNPPFPVGPRFHDALESKAPALIGAVDGSGTQSSRNAQLFSDIGGGYGVSYVFYGFNVVKR